MFGFGSGDNWKHYDWGVITTYVPTESTNGFSAIDPALVAHAHAHGARIVPFSPGTEGPTGLPLTSNATARKLWVDETVQGIVRYNLDGINFDYETPLACSDPRVGYYTMLVNETRVALQAAIPTAQVSVDVAWSPQTIDGRCYDLLG